MSHPPNQLDQLRDVGSVDVGTVVAVHVGRDDEQTPTVTLSLRPVRWDAFCDALWRTCWELDDFGIITLVDQRHILTMDLDCCGTIAKLLEDDTLDWTRTVTELRQALGLAACWVSFQDGAA